MSAFRESEVQLCCREHVILGLPSILPSFWWRHPDLSTHSPPPSSNQLMWPRPVHQLADYSKTQWLVQKWPHDQVCPTRVNSRTWVGPFRKRCFLFVLLNLSQKWLRLELLQPFSFHERRGYLGIQLKQRKWSWRMNEWKWNLDDNRTKHSPLSGHFGDGTQ